MTTLDALRSGDRQALARAITLLESTRPDHRARAEELVAAALPAGGESIRIGITGVPGVGKSTLVEAFGNHVIEAGHRVAVLAVDPSSRISGGSILGDKTRMPTLAVNDRAFIRPSPAGDATGGIARRTRESVILCEAAGFDVIIVETVGVGQSETLVSEMTDVFVLMLLPGSGDELQGIKRGITELADIAVVSKADGRLAEAATLTAADMQQALRFLAPRIPGWQVPVLPVSAHEGRHIDRLWDEIGTLRAHLAQDGRFADRRVRQLRDWFRAEVRALLFERLGADGHEKSLSALEARVAAGEIPPAHAARTLVGELFAS